MGPPPDKNDERAPIDVDDDPPSFVTAPHPAPTDDGPTARRPVVTDEQPTAPVPRPTDETTARMSGLLPADGESATLEAPVELPTQPRAGSAPEITTAHGLTHGPASSPVAAAQRRTGEDWDEKSNASLITPRMDLVAAELAFADTAHAERDGGRPSAPKVRLPADEEPDTTRLGADEEDRTMPRPSSSGRAAAPESPRAAVVLPAMRPRLDSEAAGHWPSWQSETEGAREALAAVVSPVSSDTAALPRHPVDDPLASLRSRIEAGLAKTQQAHAPPPFARPATQRLEPAPAFPPAPVSAAPPAFPPSEGSASIPPRQPRPRRRALTPIAVFLATFFVAGGVLGALIVGDPYGWLARLHGRTPSGAGPSPPTAPDPAASSVAPPPDTASDAPPSTTASSPIASASSSAPPPPRGGRPRARPGTHRPHVRTKRP